MKKIRAVIERKDKDRLVLKSNGHEFSLPQEIVNGRVGELVVITLSSEEEDARSSTEVAKALLQKALKGE